MKRIILLFLIILSLINFSYSQETQWIRLCIDPGHGGPGAEKYGCNGGGYNNYAGALGFTNQLTEQWINLHVALELKNFTEPGNDPNWWQHTNIIWEWVELTRYEDTTNISLSQRADSAKANDATHFISIHHNGFAEACTAWQGTEVFWCNAATTGLPDNLERDTTYLLAQKILFQILNEWGYMDRCSLRCYPAPGKDCKLEGIRSCMTCYDVLRLTTMASALSEASDISMHPSEESRFEEFDFAHGGQEAWAIFDALCSFINNGGIASITTCYIGGDGAGCLYVDEEEINPPYTTCWEAGTVHRLIAPIRQYLDDYDCWFSFWREVETEDTTDVSDFWTTVPAGESTHTYIAYYKGGYYSVDLCFPNSGEFTAGDSIYIDWYSFWTSLGVDESALIDAYLDRNGGADGYPEQILSDIPVKYYGYWWQVKGPASDLCKIKLVSQDCVDNYAEDESDYHFSIVVPNISGDANSDGIVDLADALHLAKWYFGKPGFYIDPVWKADVNGDCIINLGDARYLASYLLSGGPVPWCNPECWDCI